MDKQLTTNKRCGSCRKTKPRAEFHQNKANKDGLGICMECKREGDRRRYANNAETRAKVQAKNRAWKKANRQRDNAYRKNNPKEKARKKLRHAVERGKITKPKRCERCNEPTPKHLLQGHHRDYDKPLDVEWLCSSCHPR